MRKGACFVSGSKPPHLFGDAIASVTAQTDLPGASPCVSSSSGAGGFARSSATASYKYEVVVPGAASGAVFVASGSAQLIGCFDPAANPIPIPRRGRAAGWAVLRLCLVLMWRRKRIG